MKNQKLLIIVIAVVVLGLGGYLYFTGQAKPAEPSATKTLSSDTTGSNPVALSPTGSSTASVANSAQASEIITLLKNISSIRLETRILQSPSFLALVDSSIILPAPAVSGRVNPFAPSGSFTAATTPAIGTLTTDTSTPVAPTPSTSRR